MMNRKIKKTFTYLILICISVIMVGPFLWLLLSSLLPNTNVYDFPYNVKLQSFSISNFTGVFEFVDFGNYIWNTVLISGASVSLNALIASMTAYPLAKLNFKGKDILFTIIISAMIIPSTAAMVVNYLTITKLGISDSYLGVILPTSVTIFNIFNMRQAFLNIPDSIRESGRMDGASELRIFFSLIMPMVKPSLAVVVLFQFMASWNDFLWPMIVLNSTSKYPLSAALTMLNGQFAYNFGWVAAGTVLSILPTLFIFVLTQDMFVDGVSGANKG